MITVVTLFTSHTYIIFYMYMYLSSNDSSIEGGVSFAEFTDSLDGRVGE